jgi:hypothetical protein
MKYGYNTAMKRKELIVTSLSLGGLLIVLNEVALFLNLFWTLWWLDLVFHYIGGLAVGGLAVGFFVKRDMDFWKAASVILLTTVAVALLWESYELIFRETYTQEYVVDTITDIILGVAGGISALYSVPRNVLKNT